MHVVAGVTKNVHSDQSWKVPHMVHSNGAWVECSPPSHNKLNVTLSVAVESHILQQSSDDQYLQLEHTGNA